MTGFDPKEFLWEYRASRHKPEYYDSLIALLPRPCVRLLDAGCGAGRLAIRLADHAQWVTGLDLSENMLALAQRRYATTDLHNIAWLRGNLHSLPFPSSTFDCVVSTSVLHLVDMDRALPELKRVAKPGGKLLLWDWRCPAPVRRITIWPFRFALGASMKALATYGLGPAWQVAVREWQGEFSRDRTAQGIQACARARDACSRHLPGWQLAQEQDMLIVWENPW